MDTVNFFPSVLFVTASTKLVSEEDVIKILELVSTWAFSISTDFVPAVILPLPEILLATTLSAAIVTV